MQLVCVGLTGEDRIDVYEQRGEEGLVLCGEAACPGVVYLTADPGGRRLFAATGPSAELLAYDIDPRTGALSPLGAIPNAEAHEPNDWQPGGQRPDAANFIATDRSGKWLLSAHYSAASASVHAINPEGTIAPTPTSRVQTARGCHCIRTSLDNRWAFATCIAAGTWPSEPRGGNRIFMFAFDDETGVLTPTGELAPATPPPGGVISGLLNRCATLNASPQSVPCWGLPLTW